MKRRFTKGTIRASIGETLKGVELDIVIENVKGGCIKSGDAVVN